MALADAPRNLGGRPSNSQLIDRLERARLRNVSLRDELTALRAERATDVATMRPAANRLAMIAREFGPEAYGAAMQVLERLDRMERRDRKVVPFTGPEAA